MNNSIDNEAEIRLIDGLIKNHNDAFEELVRNYSTKMYSIARRFFSNNDDANECLQMAFIQVFKNIQSFRQDSSLTTWLHRITVNAALMMLRSKKKQKTISIDDFDQHYNEYGERTVFANNTENNIEIIFEQYETQLEITKTINELPEKYCNVLLLRDIQELSTRETAQILAISEASVKTQLHRARLYLKNLLEQQNNFTNSKDLKDT